MIITTSISAKLRILWSVLLSLVLSSSAFAEVYFLNNDDSFNLELSLFDEESKAESEKAEEKGERKTGENPFEFSGADGEFDSVVSNLCAASKLNTLSPCSCSYLYYPHINPAQLAVFRELLLGENSLFVLYHKLIFYELISNLH
jgi:hypothetical protein